MEFKGTKGPLERKYVTGVCFGIGTVGNFSQITANSILPETDKQYAKEKTEIEANMLLYSKAPEMLEMLVKMINEFDAEHATHYGSELCYEAKQLIKEATEI
jgi:hypothetical protein